MCRCHPLRALNSGKDYIPVECQKELNEGTLKVPATILPHNTHNESARKMIKQIRYLFIPHEKKGKLYSQTDALNTRV